MELSLKELFDNEEWCENEEHFEDILPGPLNFGPSCDGDSYDFDCKGYIVST